MATDQYHNEPIQIGTDKQLFLGPWTEDGSDEYLVESMRNLEMSENEAQVTGERLMGLDVPWEGTGMLDMRQFVLRDSDRFRMYYSALPYSFVREGTRPEEQYSQIWEKPHQRILCYAESEDGVHWVRRSPLEPFSSTQAFYSPGARGNLLEQDDLGQQRHPGQRRAVVLLRRSGCFPQGAVAHQEPRCQRADHPETRRFHLCRRRVHQRGVGNETSPV